MWYRIGWSVFLFLLLVAAPVQAKKDTLFGDLGGLRSALEARGIQQEVALTLDIMHNARGGVEPGGTVLGNLNVILEFDTQRMGLWKNGSFMLYLLGNTVNDRLLTDLVGDFQTTSNIEAHQSFKLYEAWYEHLFYDDSVSVLLGLHDYNGEFDVLEYAGLFTNSSFGIQPDISQVGPPIFPLTTSMALRLRVNPSKSSYLMAALYDGVSGDPDHPARTAVLFDKGDGIFGALELGLGQGAVGSLAYYKLALGAWLHTSQVELFDGSINSENTGVYLIAEKTLYSENGRGEGLGAFVQLGLSDPDLNQVASYWGAGLHYTGLFPGRPGDRLGLAVASARNGETFMAFKRRNGEGVEYTETAIELTYRAEVFPWLILQPDMQYIINPGMDPALENALIAGVRVEVVF